MTTTTDRLARIITRANDALAADRITTEIEMGWQVASQSYALGYREGFRAAQAAAMAAWKGGVTDSVFRQKIPMY